MRVPYSYAIAAVALLAFSQPTPSLEAQQPPPSASGRYQVVMGPAGSGQAVLLDSQTGRTWYLCRTPSDTTRVVDFNWCLMQYYGGAPGGR